MMLTKNSMEFVDLENYLMNRPEYTKFVLHVYERNKTDMFATPEDCKEAVFGKEKINMSKLNNIVSSLASDKIIYNPTVKAYTLKKDRPGFENEFPGLSNLNLKIPPGNRPSALIALNPIYWEKVGYMKSKQG